MKVVSGSIVRFFFIAFLLLTGCGGGSANSDDSAKDDPACCTPAPDNTEVITPDDGTISEPIKAPDGARILAFDGTYLWSASNGVLQKLDPDTGNTLQTLNLPQLLSNVIGLTFDGQFLWVMADQAPIDAGDGASQTGKGMIFKVNPETGEVL